MGGGHGGVSGGGSGGSGGGVSPVGGAGKAGSGKASISISNSSLSGWVKGVGGKFPRAGSTSLFSSPPGSKSRWRLVEIPGDSPLSVGAGIR